LTNTWNILDIEPTKDLAEIKRAYAKKLKKCRPEEDLDGFQELRDAFEEAKWYSSSDYTYFEEELEEPDSQEELDFLDDEDSLTDDGDEIEFDETFDDYDEEEDLPDNKEEPLYGKLLLLYDDFAKRRDVASWKELLENDASWDFEARWRNNNIIVDFLMEHHYLPMAVWSYLEGYLIWSEDFEDYEDESDIVGGLREYVEIKQSPLYNLSYDTIEANLDIDYEKYLTLRDEAFDLIRDGELAEAKVMIKKAKSIYSKDSELIFLSRQNSVAMGNQPKYDLKMKEFLDEHPEHILAQFEVAKILLDDHCYSESLVLLKKLESGPWTDGSLESLTGYCLNMLGRKEEAYQKYQEAYLKDERNIFALEELTKLSRKFRLKLMLEHYTDPFSKEKKEKYHTKKREHIKYRDIFKGTAYKYIRMLEVVVMSAILFLFITPMVKPELLPVLDPIFKVLAPGYVVCKLGYRGWLKHSNLP